MLELHVLPLADEGLREAYPLVRAAELIGLESWLTFARALAAIEGGVLGARADDGCLYGVATFVPLPCLRNERILTGEIVAAIDLGSANRIRSPLYEALEGLASALDCTKLVATDRSSSCMPFHRWRVPDISERLVDRRGGLRS